MLSVRLVDWGSHWTRQRSILAVCSVFRSRQVVFDRILAHRICFLDALVTLIPSFISSICQRKRLCTSEIIIWHLVRIQRCKVPSCLLLRAALSVLMKSGIGLSGFQLSQAVRKVRVLSDSGKERTWLVLSKLGFLRLSPGMIKLRSPLFSRAELRKMQWLRILLDLLQGAAWDAFLGRLQNYVSDAVFLPWLVLLVGFRLWAGG